MKTHPTQTPEYWERLAADERAQAAAKRSARWGTVESIRIHEQNAKDYDETARKLRTTEAA